MRLRGDTRSVQGTSLRCSSLKTSRFKSLSSVPRDSSTQASMRVSVSRLRSPSLASPTRSTASICLAKATVGSKSRPSRCAFVRTRLSRRAQIVPRSLRAWPTRPLQVSHLPQGSQQQFSTGIWTQLGLTSWLIIPSNRTSFESTSSKLQPPILMRENLVAT